MKTALVPPGLYVVGDPCYTVRRDDWRPLLESANYFLDDALARTRSGRVVVGFSTKYGDGLYHTDSGIPLGVDSGMMGLVQVEPGEVSSLSLFVEFLEPTTVSENDGVIQLGDIVIDTNDEEPQWGDFRDEEIEDEEEARER